jgi:hypothetical protein
MLPMSAFGVAGLPELIQQYLQKSFQNIGEKMAATFARHLLWPVFLTQPGHETVNRFHKLHTSALPLMEK